MNSAAMDCTRCSPSGKKRGSRSRRSRRVVRCRSRWCRDNGLQRSSQSSELPECGASSMEAIRRYLGLVFWIAAIGALGGHCLVFADDKQEFDELWKRADAITSQKNPGAVLEFMD